METVIILMSTYNGESYLQEQLNSIYSQVGVEVKVLVRDDGSTDNTCKILEENKKRGILQWYQGNNIRPAKSFMELIMNAPDSDYYAFCDQDDIWLPNKLEKAVSILKKKDNNIPALYYGRPLLVDKEGVPLKQQPKKSKPSLTVNQAVVSSNATGCTMCFNRKLVEYIKLYKPDYQIMHDGWVHKVCIAVGGEVYFDETPYIYYRQHGNNVIGGEGGFIKKWKGRWRSLRRDPCTRSKAIKELYTGYSGYMSEDVKEICFRIMHYNDNIKGRSRLLFNRTIKTGNFNIDAIYRIAVLLGIF